MMYKEIRIHEIPCITFLKGTKYNLYVGPKLSWFERRKLKKVESEYNVLYLYDYSDSFSADKLSYNFPGAEFPEGFTLDTVFSKIRESIGENVNSDSKFFIRYDGESFVAIIDNNSLKSAIAYLIQNGDKFKPESSDDELQEIVLPHLVEPQFESFDDEFLDCEEVQFRITEHCQESNILFRSSPKYSVADASFDTAMTKAAEDVKKAIDALLMTGFPVDIIQSWLTDKVKLSRLRITRQFKILLVDYDKEIKMGPLPKTVFLFYLRHPEGVKFSYLQDHIDELWHIYSHVSVNDDLNKMRVSIASLIDPFSNSICEKCAAIKKAFVLQVNDNIAKNYYVTGMQGGEKGIALDRNLVEWECQL